MQFRLDFYRFDEHVGTVDFAGSLVDADKAAVAGLKRLDANRATITDRHAGGQTVMVIVG